MLPFETSNLGNSYKASSMYALTGILIFFGALVYPISLTAPMSLDLIVQTIQIPIILAIVVLTGYLYSMVMFAKLIGLCCMMLPKKYRKIITKMF